MAIIKIRSSQLANEIAYKIKKNNELSKLILTLNRKFSKCIYLSIFMFLLFTIGLIIASSFFKEYFLFVCIFEIVTLSSFFLILIYGHIRFEVKADEYRKDLNEHYSLERIKILEEGLKGEELALETLQQLNDNYMILHGISLNVNGQQFELDFLILSNNGAFLVENKHWNGHITGNSSDKNFKKLSYDNWGNPHEDKNKKNPIIQVTRTLNLFKQFLADKNINIFIDKIVYFSNENSTVHVQDTRDVNVLCAANDDIVSYIQNHKSHVNDSINEKIVRVINEYLEEFNTNP